VGDAGFRVKCFERIGNFREQGKTIILVSHDAEQIRDFCDRAPLIHNGELIADTSPEAALARYEEVIGHPQPRTVSALPGR
jgi:ABC-type polysaccharide/polyol phosphate transport system ATPase subunit